MGEVMINKASVFQPRTTYIFVMSEFQFETIGDVKLYLQNHVLEVHICPSSHFPPEGKPV